MHQNYSTITGILLIFGLPCCHGELQCYPARTLYDGALVMFDSNAQQPPRRHFVGVIAIKHGLLLLGDPLQVISTSLGAMGFDAFLEKHIDPVSPPHWWGPYRVQRTSNREDGVRALILCAQEADASYPVFAEVDGGNIRRITIEFTADEAEEEAAFEGMDCRCAHERIGADNE